MTKAPMTPKQIAAAGYSIGKHANIDSAEQLRRPWVVHRRDSKGTGNYAVLARYATYGEAVAALHVELTDPDGVLREGGT